MHVTAEVGLCELLPGNVAPMAPSSLTSYLMLPMNQLQKPKMFAQSDAEVRCRRVDYTAAVLDEGEQPVSNSIQASTIEPACLNWNSAAYLPNNHRCNWGPNHSQLFWSAAIHSLNHLCMRSAVILMIHTGAGPVLERISPSPGAL